LVGSYTFGLYIQSATPSPLNNQSLGTFTVSDLGINVADFTIPAAAYTTGDQITFQVAVDNSGNLNP
jgi:hypothetical protein